MTLTSLQPFFIYTLFFLSVDLFGILLLIYCIFYFVKQYFCCFSNIQQQVSHNHYLFS